MRSRALHILLLILPAFVACKRSGVSPQEPSYSDVPIVCLVDKVADGTAKTAVTDADNLGNLWITAKDDGGYKFSNQEFVKDGGQYKASKYWPASDTHYDFCIANVPLDNENVNVADTTKDIVCAWLPSGKYTYKQPLNVSLDHIFARIGQVSVTAPDDGCEVNQLRIFLTPNISGVFSIPSFEWTSSTAAPDTAHINCGLTHVPADSTSSTSEKGRDLYLVPGTYSLTAGYYLKKGLYAGEYVTKTADVTLAIGCINKISCVIPNSGDIKAIEFTVEVEAWEEYAPTGAEFHDN